MFILPRRIFLAATIAIGLGVFSLPSAVPTMAAGTQIADSTNGRGFYNREIEIIRDYFFEAEEYERGKKKGRKKGKGHKKNKNKYADHDRRYMSEKVKKRKGLPPGIMKQIREGKRIPDEVSRYPLPDYLRTRLPVPPRGTRRVLVNNDILLIRTGTNLVLDIIENVLNQR